MYKLLSLSHSVRVKRYAFFIFLFVCFLSLFTVCIFILFLSIFHIFSQECGRISNGTRLIRFYQILMKYVSNSVSLRVISNYLHFNIWGLNSTRLFLLLFLFFASLFRQLLTLHSISIWLIFDVLFWIRTNSLWIILQLISLISPSEREIEAMSIS